MKVAAILCLFLLTLVSAPVWGRSVKSKDGKKTYFLYYFKKHLEYGQGRTKNKGHYGNFGKKFELSFVHLWANKAIFAKEI